MKYNTTYFLVYLPSDKFFSKSHFYEDLTAVDTSKLLQNIFDCLVSLKNDRKHPFCPRKNRRKNVFAVFYMDKTPFA